MKHITSYIIWVIVGIGALFVSCSDQLDQTNPNNTTDQTFWQSESDFSQALTACYSPLKNGLDGGYYGTRGIMLRISRSDEVDFRNDISEIYQTYNFTNSTGNSLVQGMFYQFYNALYRINTVLQKMDEKKDILSTDFVNKMKGECLFLRGFYLFQLGKEFKDAPLRLIASQVTSTFPLKKSSQEEIWSQALTDLQASVNFLPMKTDIGKPTKGAAYAVMGKIYLYENKFDEAIKVLEPLTKSPYTYELVKNYEWNFDDSHEGNAESIFEIPIDNVGGSNPWAYETLDAAQTNTRPKEYAAPEVGGWYEANPTDQMLKILTEEKDKDGNYDYRARVSVAWDYPGCTYYMKNFRDIFPQDKWNTKWILKYQNWNTQTSEPDPPLSCINERAIRYADVILQLAECYLRSTTQKDLQKAVSYINMIRFRANLNDYSGPMNYDDIFSDLEHQRAIEFFVEGERFYDLRRWGLLDDRIKTCSGVRYKQLESGKVGETNRYYYYPIPSKELETNNLCTPSTGW